MGRVSDVGAVRGVAVTGAANGVAVAGAANGVAVTGAAAGVVALLGCVAGPGANGGVAVDGIGMAGPAAATGGCDDGTFALLPGAGATAVGTCATLCCPASCLRAAVAAPLFGLNGGGSVGFLT